MVDDDRRHQQRQERRVEHLPRRVRLQLAHDQLVPEVDAVGHQADQRQRPAGQQPADQPRARIAEDRWKQQEEAEQAVEDLARDVGAGAPDRQRIGRQARPAWPPTRTVNAATTQQARSAPGFVIQRSTLRQRAGLARRTQPTTASPIPSAK